MYIIVGLGNPGQKYANTRHNVGFMVVDRLKKLGWPKSKCLLVKPQTFMNRSGEAVRKLIEENPKSENRIPKQSSNFEISASNLNNIWVIHDDLDLALGTTRINFGGSSAGHKGVQSVIDALGSNQFWRIRVGIGRPVGISERSETSEKREASYVLASFNDDERLLVSQVIEQAAHKILSNLEKGGIVNETFRVS